jgi:type IV fimbrial biogenesis protein FimT
MLRPLRLLSGVSLWELLTTLAIVAVLYAAAVPSFGITSARARLTAGVNALVGSLHLARTAAMLRNAPTAVCLSMDGVRCADRIAPDARGWLVFHDIERGGAVQLDTHDVLLRRVDLPGRITVQGTRAAVTYWPTSRAGTTSTFLLCHEGRADQGRAVVVSQTGRPRTVLDGSWNDRLRCAS